MGLCLYISPDSHMYEYLIFVNTGHNDEIWYEKTDEGISSQTTDVRPNDRVNLTNKWLDKTVQSSNLQKKQI